MHYTIALSVHITSIFEIHSQPETQNTLCANHEFFNSFFFSVEIPQSFQSFYGFGNNNNDEK